MKIFTFVLTILLYLQIQTVVGQNVIEQNLKEINSNFRLKVSSDKSHYSMGDSIIIEYNVTNISTHNQKIVLKDYYDFPMGMATNIINSKNESICKYPTSHMLSSRIFTEDELQEFAITIEPGKSLEGKVVLQEIPIFVGSIKNGIIPPDKYKVSLTFWGLKSNNIRIEIKNNWPQQAIIK